MPRPPRLHENARGARCIPCIASAPLLWRAECAGLRDSGRGSPGCGAIEQEAERMDEGDVDVTARGDVDQLKGNAVGLYSILFLCVTGSAPLAVFIYNTPFTMPYGSGTNGPATFAFATIILTIFSIAYAEMAKKVRAAGGMYTYVSHGLGQQWGMMAGYSLMIGYAIFGVALLGGFSNFAQVKLAQYDVHVNWLWLALIGVGLVVFLAYFDVEISARVLGIALISEVTIILIVSIAFFANAQDVAVSPILPWNGLNSGAAPGIAVFFAFWSWVGFEAAPNYAEEAKDPIRVIPVALIFSCIAVGVLYTFMSWAIVSVYGTNTDWSTVAASSTSTHVFEGKTVPVDYDHFVLGPAGAVAGQFWSSALSYLIITGSLACAAALTNAGLRYMYAMGREGLLPRYLGKTHPVHRSPYMAVLTWGAFAAVLFVIFRATSHTGLDAYFWLSPQGVIWIVLVQALTALSVFLYFRRDHASEQSWKTRYCAWIGFIAQLFVLALFYHYSTTVALGSALYVKELTTVGSSWYAVPISWLGIIGVIVPLASLGYAYFLKASNPEKYALAGRFVNEAA